MRMDRGSGTRSLSKDQKARIRSDGDDHENDEETKQREGGCGGSRRKWTTVYEE